MFTIRPISWYIRFVLSPLLFASVVTIGIEVISWLPVFVSFTLMFSIPLIWLVKSTGAFIVGYKTSQEDTNAIQGVVGGIIYGIGIGIVVLLLSFMRKLLGVQTEFFGVFGGFDVFFRIGVEMIGGAIFSAVGSVLAGGTFESLKKQ